MMDEVLFRTMEDWGMDNKKSPHHAAVLNKYYGDMAR